MKGLIGKVGMTQLIEESGKVVPVTLIEAGPCYVTQVRTVAKEGYDAVQLGFGETAPKRLSGAEKGHLQRNKLPPVKHLHEFRGQPELKEGETVTVNIFAIGEAVDVVGVSKGKGFQGAIRRYHFSRQPTTHGASNRTRSPGSSSQGTTPGHVYKGKRRAGHMGLRRVTSQNITVVRVYPDQNLIAVDGSVPGSKGDIVLIHGKGK